MAAHHGAICANDEDFTPVCGRVRSSRTAEIPAGGLIWSEGKCGRVVDLACYEHKARPFRDRQHITAAQLDVRRSVGPAIDIGSNTNHHAAGRWMALQV